MPVADSKDNTAEDHSMIRCSSWHSRLGNSIEGSLRKGKGFVGSIVVVAIGCTSMCKGTVGVRFGVRFGSGVKVGVGVGWEIRREEWEFRCQCWDFMSGH